MTGEIDCARKEIICKIEASAEEEVGVVDELRREVEELKRELTNARHVIFFINPTLENETLLPVECLKSSVADPFYFDMDLDPRIRFVK